MGLKVRTSLIGMVSALALSILCSPVFAQEGEAKWRHSWTGYVWVPGLDGNIGVRNVSINVDASVSDTIDALSDLDGSFSGHYEGTKGPWTFIADLMFFRLETDATTALGRFESEPEQWLAELAAARTVYYKRLPDEDMSEIVQLLGGVRYSRLELSVENTTTGAQVDGDEDWYDPFIGARYRRDLSKKWEFAGRFDFGGFGVGSDFTWNLVTAFGYRFSRKRAVILGWRILDQDFDEDNFRWDIQMSGPFVALRSQF
jgi:hypothetical protein